MGINFMAYGRISENINMQYKKTKANMRIESADIKNSYVKQIQDINKANEKSHRVDTIIAKLKAGEPLSAKELDYLKENNPALHEKAMKIANERDAHNKRLRSCKTKDDVVQVQLQKCKEIETAVKNGEGIEFNSWRMAAVNRAYTKFVASKEYSDLPTKAEIEKEKNKTEQKRKEKEIKELFEKISKQNNQAFEKINLFSDTVPDGNKLVEEHTQAKEIAKQERSEQLQQKREWLQSIRWDISQRNTQINTIADAVSVATVQMDTQTNANIPQATVQTASVEIKTIQ